MLPSLAMHDCRNSTAVHAENGSKLIHGPFARFVELADGKNGIVGELGIPNFCTTQMIASDGLGMFGAMRMSTLFPHISVVVGDCADPQVGGVATPPVVTGMAYNLAFWNWARGKLVSHPMGLYWAFLTSSSKPTITIGDGGSPGPAGIRASRLIHLGPESCWHTLFGKSGPDTVMMPSNESDWLSLDPSSFGIRLFSDWRKFATPALTVTDWDIYHIVPLNHWYNYTTDGGRCQLSM